MFNASSTTMTLVQFSAFQAAHRKLQPIFATIFEIIDKANYELVRETPRLECLTRAYKDAILYDATVHLCKKDETMIYDYFINLVKFFSFLIGRAEAELFLFLNWFLPKVLGRDCVKEEMNKLIDSLLQKDIPALAPISTRLTLKNGKQYVISLSVYYGYYSNF